MVNPVTNKFEQLYGEVPPWKLPNANGELPGGICCQRAAGRFCYEHDPDNYPHYVPDYLTMEGALLRPNGEPVPKHWSLFEVDKTYVINNYTFRCKYIGETSILFEPVGPEVFEDLYKNMNTGKSGK